MPIISATQPKWKLDNSVLYGTSSRLLWQRPYLTCCPDIYMAVTTLHVLSQHNRNPLNIFTIYRFIYMLNSPVPALHLLCACQGSIRKKYHYYNYLLLCPFLVFWYSRRGGNDGYPNQDSTYFYAIFHWENLKKYSLNSFLTEVSRYFYTLFISNCKVKIATVPWIAL